MMRGIWILIASAGCRQIFGISDPQAAADDADSTLDVQHAIDGSVVDANNAGEVAHFAFDMIAGNKTPDDVGHHDATCTDSTRPTVVPGHHVAALQFVSPDYVVIPALAMTDGELTIAVWVKTLGLPSGTTLDCLLYQAQTLSLCVGSNGQVTFATTNNGMGNALIASHALATGTWSHLAVTYDGHTKRIFIDGIVDATADANVTSASGAIDVGAAADGDQPASYADAVLDELAIYARALAPSEIQALASQ